MAEGILKDEELGRALRAFRPSMVNVGFVFLMAAAAVGGSGAGIVYLVNAALEAHGNIPADSKFGISWNQIYLIGGLCLLGIAVGLLIAWFGRCLLAGGAVFYENGLARVRRRKVEMALWSDVVKVKQIDVLERPPILKGVAILLVPKVKSTSYIVLTGDGRQLHFFADAIGDFKALVVLLKAEAERRQIPWEIEVVDVGL